MLFEHRQALLRVDDEASEPEMELQPSPTTGKWLLDSFKRLKDGGRLRYGSVPAAATLALVAQPKAVTFAAAGPSGSAPDGKRPTATRASQTMLPVTPYKRLALEYAVANKN